MSRGLRVLLFASLALNLLVVGLAIGAGLAMRHAVLPGAPGFDRPGGLLAAALSREDRRAIGRALFRTGALRRPGPDEIRAEYAPVIEALKAVPYDGAAVRAAIDHQLAAAGARAELGRDMLLERLSAMSDAERAAYAERLQDLLDHPPAPAWREHRRPGARGRETARRAFR